MVHAWRASFGGHDSVFGVSPYTIVHKVSSHVMFAHPPSHYGSDGAGHSPPHHTTSVLPSESPRSPHSPHISTHNLDCSSSSHLHSVSCSVCVCELVHLTVMTLILESSFLSPLSLTPARPSPSPSPAPPPLNWPFHCTILQHS